MRKAWGKSGVLGVLLLALLLGLLLAAGPAGAVTKTPFTTVLGPVDDPAWSYGYEWWTHMGMTQHNRDQVVVLWWQSSDPRLTGVSVTTRQIEGHWIYGTKIWQEQEEGTATLSVMRKHGRDPVGVWESSYTAVFTLTPYSDPVVQTFVVNGVGRGVSGSVAGLRFEYTIIRDSNGDDYGSGYIIEP